MLGISFFKRTQISAQLLRAVNYFPSNVVLPIIATLEKFEIFSLHIATLGSKIRDQGQVTNVIQEQKMLCFLSANLFCTFIY